MFAPERLQLPTDITYIIKRILASLIVRDSSMSIIRKRREVYNENHRDPYALLYKEFEGVEIPMNCAMHFEKNINKDMKGNIKIVLSKRFSVRSFGDLSCVYCCKYRNKKGTDGFEVVKLIRTIEYYRQYRFEHLKFMYLDHGKNINSIELF